MRIISGRFKSRQLKGTPPAGTRPTSDKLRETLFNILSDRVADAKFLDMCAGVGAIGIEALSRGAAHVHFVDQSRKSVRIIRQNLELLDVREGFTVLEVDVVRASDIFVRDKLQFDIAFVDPPYERQDLYETVLRDCSDRPILSSGGMVIFEHSKRVDMAEAHGNLRKFRSLVQGDSALTFYQRED